MKQPVPAGHQARDVRFTALMHHVTPHLLIDSFMQLKRTAAAGVDGVTWCEYEEGLVARVYEFECSEVADGINEEPDAQRIEPEHQLRFPWIVMFPVMA